MTPITKQPAIDIDSLAVGKQLDHAIMEHILGWIHNPKGVRCADCWLLPNSKIHSGDAPISTSRFVFDGLVEPEIEKRGLLNEYAAALYAEIERREQVVITLLSATVEERCRAILHVVLERESNESD